ncbi:unnamed protein product (macronuclear) [Paramecium tetraurelia]|uniref:Uncharacterized protein n=1 Tax=Paramecium tetraurelia TaxID=5888 RepID=A0CX11_PARTE|nr:uncharacterized protein GSPATT00001531001 [Paramecium tetraurelia]CAK75328.1 unnamed protein product [Paramecium tetraurelia]|eukprot:XP_001442725.1 hypothetical protein (macronuclear) [Paramecium tetraurelia strain d4-2]
MGNNQSQKNQTKSKKKDPLLFLFGNNKKQIIFSKLSLKTLSLLTSFLTIQEYHNILLTSKATYQLFIQTSGCFQIECQRLLNVKGDLIISQNWKKIIQSIVFIPIRGIPFSDAIKSVRHQIKQIPIIIEQKVYYSGFQKAILYFQNKSNDQKFSFNEYQESIEFANKNSDLILKLRQGLEVYIQLPQLLMQIYNLHDYIKIYSLYLEIKFQKCNLQQFIELWHHYAGWISILEQETARLIVQFNNIIDATFPQYRLPNYTVRQFMVSQWLKKSDRGEIIVMLREEFRLKMIESRNKNIKFQELRDYVQYLIDISTNQTNIHQYGYYNFEYCEELNKLVQLAVDLSPLLTIDYKTDENMLIYIFGQYIYDYYIFELLSTFRIEQFKQQIREHQQSSQKMTKLVTKHLEDLSLSSNNLFENQIQGFNYHMSMQYNVQFKIRSLFKQISYLDEDICQTSENIQPESLEISQISFASTNCSSILSSIKNNDQAYHYVKNYQQELFHNIELFYQKELAISQYIQDAEPRNTFIYDIPELGQYLDLQFTQIMDLFQNKQQRSIANPQSEKRLTMSIFNQSMNQQQICTKELSQAEQLLINFLK